MNCDVLLKGSKVDGIYDSDPVTNPDAKRFDHITYMDVLTKELKVMDATAISLARENNVPVIVYSILEEGGLIKALNHQGNFTLVTN